MIAPVKRGLMTHYGAKGDGITPDNGALRAAFADPDVDEIVLERTPGDTGFLVDMTPETWRTLPLKTGIKVLGEGWGSRLVRGGVFQGGTTLFGNADPVNGNDSVEFDGLCVDGGWDLLPKGTAWVGPENPNMVVMRVGSRFSLSGGQRVNGFRLERCQIKNWPGVLLAAANHAGAYIGYNDVDRISGGCFIFRYRCVNVTVIGNRALRVCDDALAFNAKAGGANEVDPEFGPARDCLSRDNEYSRFSPEWAGGSATGPVISIRGGQGIHSRNDYVSASQGEGVHLLDWMPCDDIRLVDARIANTREHALLVSSGVGGYASGLRLADIACSPRVLNASDRFSVGLA